MISRGLILASVLLAGMLLHANQPPQTGPATEKRFPPLKVPPGFKATLFACDPLIEYPSVIAAGPKPGALFVAIDYMTGLGSDGKVKSEIRLIEDTDGDGYADKATVVAGGFNSIQGLAYHDETLFVMHAPFLTTLRAKAQGQPSLGFGERKDILSGLGLKPEDNQSRLHCANGVVVGHDGWLYLALGDNGVNVPRPEGDRLIHNGGAILRCRPDGRDLHIFSTGLRNIYDIALDADLNVFTRDNENDGGTYMIRVCHSFFGADHGYPYDYYERPDYAMKPIGDFGRGSAAGGVCYLETQFPKEYRGNLLFCEWGKSVVRYELNRKGADFAPVKEIEFLTGDSKDGYPFKPTDIVVQRDGTLMVADYADGQRPKRGRGRIYHIRYVGQDAEPVNKKPKSDLEKLNSESYFERCEAQAAYERRGDAGRNDLGNAFRANELGQLGMGHALLALSKGTGGTGLGDMQVMAHGGGGPAVRAQAIRIIGDLTDPILVKHKLDAGRGDVQIAKTLATLKDRSDPRILLEIVIALGRLRWADAPAWLAKNVTKPDAALAHAAMHTLRRADNWPEVLKLLDLPDSHPMRIIAVRALADQHDATVVDGVMNRVGPEIGVARKTQYAEILARAYKKPGPWKYWGYRPGARPANTVAWERTQDIEKIFAKLLNDTDVDVRLAVLKQMQREKVSVATNALITWLTKDRDPLREAMLINLLAEQSTKEARDALLDVIVSSRPNVGSRTLALNLYLKSAGASTASALEKLATDLGDDDTTVMAEVLRRLAQHPKMASAGVFTKRLASKNADVRAAAIAGLGELRVADLDRRVLDLLSDEDVRVRRAAAGAAAKLGVKQAIEPLLKLAADTDSDTRRASLDALRRLNEPRVLPFALKALDEPALTLTALECVEEFGNAKHARTVIDLAKRSPSNEVLFVTVRMLTRWAEAEPLPIVRARVDELVAEVHGAHGALLRWRTSEPLTRADTPGQLKDLASRGWLGWPAGFGDGAEGRVILAAKHEPAKPLWLAYADVALPAPTAVEFLGSSPGIFEVFLNGKSMYRRAKPGKYVVDSDRFTATLDKGITRVLVQMEESSPVEFHLRFRRKSSKQEHEKLTQAALAKAGNIERGKKIFLDKEKSQCIKCHQFGALGERIGPELTGIGARFSRIHIIESILDPSQTIAPSFGTFVVALKNGKTLNGVKISESDANVTIADNQGQKHTIAKKDIDELTQSPISTMPEGLEARLSADEFVDLIAFLTSQKEAR